MAFHLSSFDARKARSLAALASSAPDRSPKGGLDAPIAELVTWLNGRADVCTTSSCSGRVSLYAHAAGRAKGGTWAYCSHARARPADVAAALAGALGGEGAAGAACAAGAAAGDVVLRFEPFILTAECRTREAGLQARRRRRRAARARAQPARRHPP
jgi:tRNA wybutosine-synthesizing protein 3